MSPPLGLGAPDRTFARERDAAECSYGACHPVTASALRVGTADVIVQPIAWIRTQGTWPSCGGQAPAAAIDGALASARRPPPWASAISIWRDARRRQDGAMDRLQDGIRLEYAAASLERRGWDPYRPGEDRDAVEAGRGAPKAGDDLADELWSHDKRGASVERYRIVDNDIDELDDALGRGLGAYHGTGTREPFYGYHGDPNTPDRILGSESLGGFDRGHAQRIAGRWRLSGGRRIYLLQNSWSEWWGGVHLPDGRWQPGCSWVDESVILRSWDLHVFRARI